MILEFLKNGKGELLRYFFENPDQESYLAQIARSLNKENSYYVRYLKIFVDEKILIEERKGKMRFFKLNKGHPLYDDLKNIISKTIGIEFKLNQIIEKLSNIDLAFIFGSIAKNNENITSDIDLMLVGDVDQDVLIEEVTKTEKELGREINYHIFGRGEFMKKIEEKNSFIITVLKEPLKLLKGDLDEYTKFVG